MANEDDDAPASMRQVKRIIRRKLRRRDPPEDDHLTIYPLLDLLVVLVVFMMMQFASSTAASIQESKNLLIPYSTSEIRTQDALPLQISRTEIAVDGEHALSLRNGKVDASHKQGGGTGFLINPLYEKLKEKAKVAKIIAERNPKQVFEGKVQIVADKRTPYRTLAEVIYTLGQAEYKDLRFITHKEQ